MMDTVKINGIRFYETPLGFMPSVTSVLSETMPSSKRYGLKRWKENLGAAECEAYLARCIERGNQFHTAVEDYLLRGVDSKKINPVRQVIKDIDEVQFIEKSIYHGAGFAGRIDAVVTYKGKPTILDWKTSSKPKKKGFLTDYFLQTTAYSQGLYKNTGIVADNILIVVVVDGYDEAFTYHKSRADIQTYWDMFISRLNEFKRIHPSPDF